MAEQQLYGLVLMILGGVLVAFLYDGYRLLKALLNLRGWAQDLGDLLFWLLVLPVALLTLFAASWGSLRLFLFLGAGLGAALYFFFASASIMFVGMAIVRFIAANIQRLILLFVWCNRTIASISFRLYEFVLRCCRWAWRAIRSFKR